MSRFTRGQLIRDLARAELKAEQEKATAWPEGVFARYQTVSGATVDLRWYSARERRAIADCTGCGKHFWETAEDNIRRDSQAHAETCRAMPKQGGQR